MNTSCYTSSSGPLPSSTTPQPLFGRLWWVVQPQPALLFAAKIRVGQRIKLCYRPERVCSPAERPSGSSTTGIHSTVGRTELRARRDIPHVHVPHYRLPSIPLPSGSMDFIWSACNTSNSTKDVFYVMLLFKKRVKCVILNITVFAAASCWYGNSECSLILQQTLSEQLSEIQRMTVVCVDTAAKLPNSGPIWILMFKMTV